MSTIQRVDALFVVSATAVAVCGALGVSPGWLPMEKLGIVADLGAGACFMRHALGGHIHLPKIVWRE